MNKLMMVSKSITKVIRATTVRRKTSKLETETLHISDSCVKRLKQIITEGDNLRIIVEGGGCAGFQYKFKLDKNINEDDRIFEKNDIKVVIDSTSLFYINGSTVDFQEELIRSAFMIIRNPQAAEGCSCGSSFSVKLE